MLCFNNYFKSVRTLQKYEVRLISFGELLQIAAEGFNVFQSSAENNNKTVGFR